MAKVLFTCKVRAEVKRKMEKLAASKNEQRSVSSMGEILLIEALSKRGIKIKPN